MESNANYELKNTKNDQTAKLSSFWAEGPCVLYFIRRFGCVICRYQAKQLDGLAAKSPNVKFIAIAPESLGLEEFQEGKFWNSDLYIDGSKKLYESLGLKRMGVLGTIGTIAQKKVWDINSAAKKEGISGNFKGDVYQLGGCFVVGKDGSVLYEFKQQEAADEADIPAIAKALGIEYTAASSSEPVPECTDACALPPKN